MATTTWATLLTELIVHVPGVSDDFGQQALRNAAIELCEKANVWVVDQAEIPVVASTNKYTWTVPADTEVARPVVVWLNKLPLEPVSAAELNRLYGDYMQATGDPMQFIQDDPTQFILVPKPTSNSATGAGVTAKLALRPTRTSTGMDSILIARYYDAIVAGAKARLFAMPNRPWSSAGAAAMQQARFAHLVGRALVDANKGFSGANLRVTPRRFA